MASSCDIQRQQPVLFSGDGALLGVDIANASAGGDYGVRRFLPATSTLDPTFWISGERNGSTPPADNDVKTLCAGAVKVGA